MSSRLPIEDGWRRLANGLHCHRYMLEVIPFRERQAHVDGLKRLRWSVPARKQGVLLGWQSLTRSSQPIPEQLLVNAIENVDGSFVVSLLSQHSHLLPDLTSLYAGKIWWDQDGDSVSVALKASGMSFLVSFGLDVLVVDLTNHERADRGADSLPLGCLRVTGENALRPEQLAGVILARMAEQWITAFWLTDQTHASRISAPRASTEASELRSLAQKVVSGCVFVRSQTSIGLSSAAIDGSPLLLALSGVPTVDELNRLTEFAVSSAPRMPSLNAADFLVTMSTDPRALLKYTTGLGAGQAAAQTLV